MLRAEVLAAWPALLPPLLGCCRVSALGHWGLPRSTFTQGVTAQPPSWITASGQIQNAGTRFIPQTFAWYLWDFLTLSSITSGTGWPQGHSCRSCSGGTSPCARCSPFPSKLGGWAGWAPLPPSSHPWDRTVSPFHTGGDTGRWPGWPGTTSWGGPWGAKISRGQAQDSSQKLRGSHLGVFPSLKLGAWPALPTCGFLPSAPGPRPGSPKKGLCPHGISTRQGDSVGDKAAPWIQGSESGKSPRELGFVLHPWQSVTRAGPHPQSPLKWKCQYDKGHR